VQAKSPATRSGGGRPEPAARDAVPFFNALLAAHGRAGSAAGGSTPRFYRVAGHVLCLRFAGEALAAPMGAALAHLACDPVPHPGMTVHLWDCGSTGQAPPRPPWSPEELRQAGVIRGFSNARFHTVFQVGTGLFTMLDRTRGLAVGWVRDTRSLPLPERAAPLRHLLNAWLVDHGLVFAHAGVVGRSDAGVLLVGAGGAGKSSTALACLGSPLLFAGDDYCLLDVTGNARAHSLYNTAKTHWDDLSRLPFLAPMVENGDRPDDEKAVYFLHRHASAHLIADVPLRAALVVRVSGQPDTTLAPAERLSVLEALAPGTVLLAPQWGARALTGLARLIQDLPAYELRAGTDPQQIPLTILDLLDQR